MKMNKVYFALLILVASAGCGGGGSSGAGSSSSPSISVTPTQATVNILATQQFTATVENSGAAAVDWSVNGTAGGDSTVGTISDAGLYTAPVDVPNPANVTVEATIHGTSLSATASVTVAPPQTPSITTLASLPGWGTSEGIAVDDDNNILLAYSSGYPTLGVGSFDPHGNQRWYYALPNPQPDGVMGLVNVPGKGIYFVASGTSGDGVTEMAQVGALNDSGDVVVEPSLHTLVLNDMDTDPENLSYSGGSLFLGLLPWSQGADQPWAVVMDLAADLTEEFPVRDTAVNVTGGILASPDHIVAAGSMYSNTPTTYVRYFKPDGTLVWEKTFVGFETDYGPTLGEDSSGFIYLAGVNYHSDAPSALALLKLDQNGNEIWEKTWTADNPNSGQCSAMGTSLVTSASGQLIVLGAMDCHASAFGVDPDGTIQWKFRGGAADTQRFERAVVDSQGHIYSSVLDWVPNEGVAKYKFLVRLNVP